MHGEMDTSPERWGPVFSLSNRRESSGYTYLTVKANERIKICQFFWT